MSQFRLAVIGLLVAVASISQASASFVISGDATNFVVLYEEREAINYRQIIPILPAISGSAALDSLLPQGAVLDLA
jgi:hypothetical protein